LKEHLKIIWKTKNRTAITQAVYTDNPKVDEKIIKQTFFEIFTNYDLFVLLVCNDILLLIDLGFVSCKK